MKGDVSLADYDCSCRDCAGDPCTCSLGDHCGAGPNCSCCGYVNYPWLGHLGAVARWAKAWGVCKDEAEKRMEQRETARAVKTGEICGTCGFPPSDEFCQCAEQGSHRWAR